MVLLTLQPTPKSTPNPGPEENGFTLFHIELHGDITIIKVANSDDVGLYVDADDEVKATKKRQKWSKCAFKISGFLPQDPSTSEMEAGEGAESEIEATASDVTEWVQQEEVMYVKDLPENGAQRRRRMNCCVLM